MLGRLEWCGKSERSRIAFFLKPIQPSRPVDACGFRPVICILIDCSPPRRDVMVNAASPIKIARGAAFVRQVPPPRTTPVFELPSDAATGPSAPRPPPVLGE